MHPEEPSSTPPTEGQTVPPQEQTVPPQEQTVPAAEEAGSLARANPMPIALAASFVAGVVVGRIASRR